MWRNYTDVLTDAALSTQLAASSAGLDDRTRPLPFDDDAEPF